MKIYAIGDLHGRFQPIRDFHLRHNTNKSYNKEEKFLILLGDSGLNYYLDSRDKTFKKKLSKLPFTYFVIRGNHEERASNIARNNSAWQFENFWGNLVLVEKEFPNINSYVKTKKGDAGKVISVDFIKRTLRIQASPDVMPITCDLEDIVEVKGKNQVNEKYVLAVKSCG